MTADSVVRARIDSGVKSRATAVLADIGLNPSDLIRMTFKRVADEGRLPFPPEAPNKVTREALAELDRGEGQRFDTVESLMADLNG
jgi:DNA-damage-inducible protein J